MAKMFRYFLGLGLTLYIFTPSFANEIGTEGEADNRVDGPHDDENQVKPVQPSPVDTNILDEHKVRNDIEELIEKIEDLTAQAEKTIKEGILPIEYTHEIYSNIEETVEELVELLNETTNIYKFLSAKGIERIVLLNIGIPHPPLKRQLLLLIKALFDVAPITVNAVIPRGIVDKVLDIFEHDNLALKAHALDILYVWLPDNPVIQTRVMKFKGLEPFYQQISKLDAGVIGQLLDLFNKILTEHVVARRKDVQKSKADHDRVIMYQRIGLIERVSTPIACNGLLNILEKTWSFNTEGKDISQPIIEAVKNIQPFCINFFKAKPKRTKLFHELLKYISDPIRKSKFEKLGLNVTDIEIILNEYSNIFKDVFAKDEF